MSAISPDSPGETIEELRENLIEVLECCLKTDQIWINLINFSKALHLKIIYLILLSLFFPLSATAQYGHWEVIYSDTSPGWIAAQALAGIGKGKALMFGGYIGNDSLINQTWLFDLESKNWTEINCKTKPKPRDLHAMTQLSENKVIMFGGKTEFGDTVLSDIWIFDLDSLNWFELQPDTALYARYYHQMAILNDSEVVIFGGAGIWGYFSSLTNIYNLFNNTHQNINPNPFGPDVRRSYHALANLDSNIVLMFSGDRWYDSEYLDNTWLFLKDSITNKWVWRELTDLKKKFAKCHLGAAAKIKKGLVLYFGGSCLFDPTPDTWSEKTWLFNYKGNTWIELDLDFQPEGRTHHKMTNIAENKVLLYGGFVKGVQYKVGTWIFTLDSVPSGVEDIVSENKLLEIKVRDNTIDIFTYQFMQNGVVEIYNLQGILVYRSELTQSGTNPVLSIPTDNFISGLYLVLVKTDYEIISEKVMLMR